MTRPTGSGRRRVAILVPALDGGGGERVAVTLANQLAHRHDVTVITYRGLCSPRARPWRHVHLQTNTRGPVRAAVLSWRLRRELGRSKTEAVLGVLTYSNTLLFLASLGWRGRPRLLASEHNPITSITKDAGWRSRAQRMILPLMYRRIPVTVVSQPIADELRAMRRDRRVDVSVIPNPIDLGEIVTLAAQPRLPRPRLPSDSVEIVSVARLHPQKGLDVLLDAMALLPQQYVLTLVGEGPLRETLERHAVSLRIENRVLFRGFLSNPYPEMMAASVVVLASAWEGFGVVALEAAALDQPFIGTRCDGLAEVCRQLGYPTVSPGSASELAGALRGPTYSKPLPGAVDVFRVEHIAKCYERQLLGPQG